MDIAQPIEQFAFDTRRMLGGEFHRTRGPSERDPPFESAEIVKEPRATCQRGLPRPDHLEHPEQRLATVFLNHFEALENLGMNRRIRIDQHPDSVAQQPLWIFHQRRPKSIVSPLPVTPHQFHPRPKPPPPLPPRFPLAS